MMVENAFYRSKLVAPVGTNLFWMEAEHGTAIVRILAADIEDRLA
jgi:hypothetical protein